MMIIVAIAEITFDESAQEVGSSETAYLPGVIMRFGSAVRESRFRSRVIAGDADHSIAETVLHPGRGPRTANLEIVGRVIWRHVAAEIVADEEELQALSVSPVARRAEVHPAGQSATELPSCIESELARRRESQRGLQLRRDIFRDDRRCV